jgi:basic membrane protein A
VSRLGGVLGALLVALASCTGASPPPRQPSSSANQDFRVCLAIPPSALDSTRGSLVVEGADRAERTLGVDVISDEDVPDCLAQGADLTFSLATGRRVAVVIYYAQKNPETDIALLDAAVRSPLPNLVSVRFADSQGSFLAGYLAAAMSVSKIVGAIGSGDSAIASLDGFAAGIRKYNDDFGETVRLIGWDPERHGPLVSRASTADGREEAESLISHGADVIFSATSESGTEGAARVAAAVGHVSVIGVGRDQCDVLQTLCGVFLSSVELRADDIVYELVRRAATNRLPSGVYRGTPANGGLRLAPFHNYDTIVRPELKERLEELAEQIEAGSVSVDPLTYG